MLHDHHTNWSHSSFCVTTLQMIVASQSENGQVLHVIPSAQPGVTQVIIPPGQLLDVTSTQGEFNLWDLRVYAPVTMSSSSMLFFKLLVSFP